MSGWFKSTVAGWESVIAFIPKPWPRDAAINDLAYLADRSKMASEPIPGRPALAERWGWGDRKTRNLLEEIKRSSQGPAKVQQGVQRETVKPKEFDEKGPARVQPGSSQGPALTLIRQTTDQTTDNNSPLPLSKILPDCDQQPVAQAARGQAPFSENEIETKQMCPQHSPETISNSEKNGVEPHTQRRTEPEAELTPLASGPRSNSHQTHDESVLGEQTCDDTKDVRNERNACQDENEWHSGGDERVPYRRQLQGTQGLNPMQSKENPAFEVDDYALFVKHWISRTPGAIPIVSSKPAQFVRDCIRRRGLQACIDVIDWAHDSSHPTAVFLHEKGNVTFNALFKPEKEADYINLAAIWVASGKKSQALKQERNPFDTESGWAGSREIDFSEYEPIDEEIGEAFGKL